MAAADHAEAEDDAVGDGIVAGGQGTVQLAQQADGKK